jgi:aminopeptidase
MSDPRVVNLARTLIHHSAAVKPKDRVAIIGSPNAAPLIREVFRETLRSGGYPYLMMGVEALLGMDGLDRILLSEADEDQLEHVWRFERTAREEFEAAIFIRARSNTRSLSDLEPERMQAYYRSRGDMLARTLQRGAEGELNWVVSLFPTAAYAQDAEMSLSEFEDFVYHACHADEDDPVASWEALSQRQDRLARWLTGKKMIELHGQDVDLHLSVEGRSFINSAGHFNMPDGELYTSPVEDSAQGWIRFTFPAIHDGHEVEGLELRFDKGKVVEARAEKNEAFLLGQLEVDPGARYLGEFAIATNDRIDRFTRNILFDEKIGGTIHLALGNGFPQAGSKNNSAIHWDMICDMRAGGQIMVDGDLVYDSGAFKISP